MLDSIHNPASEATCLPTVKLCVRRQAILDEWRLMQFPNDDLPDPESPPPLQPPQFSLRTLLLAMFLVAALLTYWQVAGPLPTMLGGPPHSHVWLWASILWEIVPTTCLRTAFTDRSRSPCCLCIQQRLVQPL